jgi:anthranilate synthase component 2
MLVIIDNYDSFTYNLVDLFRRFTDIEVIRNDQISLAELRALPLRGLVISPGPGRPEDSGVSLPFVEQYRGELPMLGVCLGHQIMGQVLGAKVVKAPLPMHGKTSQVFHLGASVFAGLPSPLEIMRYHSLLLQPDSLPAGLQVTAKTADGQIMGIEHPALALTGLQFHPESILSDWGEKMIHNWLEGLAKKSA